jgi:polyhydroxyalkanoate synthesis regulator phasin
MARDTKMLQSILNKVSSIDKKVDNGFKGVTEKFSETNERIDKLGLQLANLEDDAPTIEDFEKLEQKVVKIQNHLDLN